MSKLMVPFETVAVNPRLDPEGGYAMRICDQQILEDDSVYEEVIKEETLPLSVKLLKFIVNAVLAATAKKVAQDCRSRRIGDEIKFSPYIRGKVTSPYASFDAATCRTSVIAHSMKGLTKKVDLDRIHFYNVKTGLRVSIDRIVYEGCVDSTQIATIMRGKGIAVTGLNCQWLEGDTCTLVWTDVGGTEHSASIAPISSTVTEMHFSWPEALDGVPVGSEVKMRFRTRGGIPDGVLQPNDKTVTLIEGEILPRIDKVATEGKDGIVKGQAFDAIGANLGFDLMHDHVSVTWMEGDVPRQAAMVPGAAAADKLSFGASELFESVPDNTELTFTFELSGKSTAKNAVLLAAE